MVQLPLTAHASMHTYQVTTAGCRVLPTKGCMLTNVPLMATRHPQGSSANITDLQIDGISISGLGFWWQRCQGLRSVLLSIKDRTAVLIVISVIAIAITVVRLSLWLKLLLLRLCGGFGLWLWRRQVVSQRFGFVGCCLFIQSCLSLLNTSSMRDITDVNTQHHADS